MTDFFPNKYFPVSYFNGPYFAGQPAGPVDPPEDLPRRSSSWIIRVIWRASEPITPTVTLRDYVLDKFKKKSKSYPKKKTRKAQPVVDYARLGEQFYTMPAAPMARAVEISPVVRVAPDPDQDLVLVLLLAA